ncbi:MAG: hypothetical protein LBP83_05120 [Dysgonamonadaceae bacterium]|jgi:hypothetical protein|nr:hypothetical protein [Dysgonamonadaceae bacterium]
MEQKTIKPPATKEFVAEKVIHLATAFYETPEELFDALIKSVLHLKLTGEEVIGVFNEAIFTIKKTRITIADILGEIAARKRKSFYDNETQIIG